MIVEVLQLPSALIICVYIVLSTVNFLRKWNNLRHKTSLEEFSFMDNSGTSNNQKIIPVSVNYHFTRACNYECGFCFHTAKTSYVMKLEDAKSGLEMLQKAGMQKINFSGGEPFLPKRGIYVGKMVKFCKQDLKMPSVTIVTNGSLVTEKWFKNYGKYLDIMAVSCDSFDEYTNKVIGRAFASTKLREEKNHIEKLKKISYWCTEYNVLFKINTVVNTYNYNDDMTQEITELNPVRWKVFQCLLLEGENAGKNALRNAERFYIPTEKFESFIDRHKNVKCLVPESNSSMQNSYLILDEYMRFLDCTGGSKLPSKSILDIGVENALKFSGFDEAMFKKRGGIYKWSKEADNMSW